MIELVNDYPAGALRLLAETLFRAKQVDLPAKALVVTPGSEHCFIVE